MIFLLLLPVLLLLSGPGLVMTGIGGIVYLAGGILHHRITVNQKKQAFLNINNSLFTCIITVTLSAWFYFRWNGSLFFQSLESLPQMPAKRICGIVAAVLGIMSLYGVDQLLTIVFSHTNLSRVEKSQALLYGYILLISVIILAVGSRCSPLYGFNDWVDPHTMFTVGKSMLHGLVPYRDVFEQKGPVLLWIHTLAALISYDNLLGMWFFEIIACFFFLLFSYKILELHLGKRALPILPFLGLLVYTTLSFEQGDSAEELCLPLLMYALFVGYSALRNQKLPKRKEWILIGITSGLMLWMKYSMIGFYLGWIVAFYVFSAKEKCTRKLFNGVGWVLIGVGIVTLPVLIWYTVKGALPDLLEVYFYDNIFLYPKTADLYGRFALARNLLNGLLNLLFFSTVVAIFSFVGIIRTVRHEERPVFNLVFFSFLGLFLMIYFSGRFYTYYSEIFGVFAPLGFLSLVDLAERRFHLNTLWNRAPGTVSAVSLAFCMLGVFCFAGNTRALAYERESFPQYKAKALIEDSGIENPTLMNYQFLDIGVDTAAGLVPSMRFFCSFNLPLEAINEEQDACLDSGCVDFVMTFMQKIASPNYELIGEYESTYSIGPFHPTYNLYQRIPDND